MSTPVRFFISTPFHHPKSHQILYSNHIPCPFSKILSKSANPAPDTTSALVSFAAQFFPGLRLRHCSDISLFSSFLWSPPLSLEQPCWGCPSSQHRLNGVERKRATLLHLWMILENCFFVDIPFFHFKIHNVLQLFFRNRERRDTV